MAAFIPVEASIDLYFRNKEPAAQQIAPPSIIKKLMSFILLPEKSSDFLSANKISTPIKPMRRPIMINLFEKLNFHSRLSSNTIHSGTVATIIAARPLEIYCSTHATAPVPKNNIRMPLNERLTTDCKSGKD